jgi:hypothetical protein
MSQLLLAHDVGTNQTGNLPQLHLLQAQLTMLLIAAGGGMAAGCT